MTIQQNYGTWFKDFVLADFQAPDCVHGFILLHDNLARSLQFSYFIQVIIEAQSALANSTEMSQNKRNWSKRSTRHRRHGYTTEPKNIVHFMFVSGCKCQKLLSK